MSAETMLAALKLYLELGLVVAVGFLALVGHLDRAARRAYAFRALLVPAAVLLWPWILVRTLGALRGRP